MNGRFVAVVALASSIFCTVFCGMHEHASADMVFGSGVFDETDIPDGGTVFSTITITDAGFIKDISVTIEGIEHSAVGDLVAELRFLGEGGPSGPGGDPAYLFFRPNVDGTMLPGSLSNLDGDYTFTTDPTDEDFWTETSIPSDQTVDDTLPFFASDTDGIYHDLGGPDFFEDFNSQGQWQLVLSDVNTFGNNIGSVTGWSIEFHVNPIPEPNTALLLLLGSCAFLIRRR